MGCIYKITNTVNGMAYIGQTRHDAYKTRIRDHLNGTQRASRVLKRAVAKYGKDAFIVEILHDGIIPELLDSYEVEAIAKHNTLAPNGYNLDTGGGGGGTLSEETKQKISESKKGENHHYFGKTLSEEHRRNLSKANKGRSSWNKGLSSWNKGKTLSEEHRRNLSEAKLGKKQGPHSEEHRRNLSEAHETPERTAARVIYFSLSDMPISEKRKYLRQNFPQKHPSTIHRWCKKFAAEQDTS